MASALPKPSVPVTKQLRIKIPKPPESCPGGISVSRYVSSLPSDGVSPGKKTVSFEFSDQMSDEEFQKIVQKMKDAAGDIEDEITVPRFKLQDPPKSKIKRQKSNNSDNDSQSSSGSSMTSSPFKNQIIQSPFTPEYVAISSKTDQRPIAVQYHSPQPSNPSRDQQSPMPLEVQRSPNFKPLKVMANKSNPFFMSSPKRTISDTQIFHKQPSTDANSPRRKRLEARGSPYYRKLTPLKDAYSSPNSKSSPNLQMSDISHSNTDHQSNIPPHKLYQSQSFENLYPSITNSRESLTKSPWKHCQQKSEDVMKPLHVNTGSPYKGYPGGYGSDQFLYTLQNTRRNNDVFTSGGNYVLDQENNTGKILSPRREKETRPKSDNVFSSPKFSNQTNKTKQGGVKNKQNKMSGAPIRGSTLSLPGSVSGNGRGEDEVDGDDDVMDCDDHQSGGYSPSWYSQGQFSDGRQTTHQRSMHRFHHDQHAMTASHSTENISRSLNFHDPRNDSSNSFSRCDSRQASPSFGRFDRHQQFVNNFQTRPESMGYHPPLEPSDLHTQNSYRPQISSSLHQNNDFNCGSNFGRNFSIHSRVESHLDSPTQQRCVGDNTDPAGNRLRHHLDDVRTSRVDSGRRNNISIPPEEILDQGEDEIVLERDEDDVDERYGINSSGDQWSFSQNHQDGLSFTDWNNNNSSSYGFDSSPTKVMTKACTNVIYIDPRDLSLSSMSCDDSMNGSDVEHDIVIPSGGDFIPKESVHSSWRYHTQGRYDETDGDCGTSDSQINRPDKVKDIHVSKYIEKLEIKPKTQMKNSVEVQKTNTPPFHKHQKPEILLTENDIIVNREDLAVHGGLRNTKPLVGNDAASKKGSRDIIGQEISFEKGCMVVTNYTRACKHEDNNYEFDDSFDEVDGFGDDNDDKEKNESSQNMDISQHSMDDNNTVDDNADDVIHCLSGGKDNNDKAIRRRDDSTVVHCRDPQRPGTSQRNQDEVDNISTNISTLSRQQPNAATNQSPRTYSVLQQHGSEQFEIFVESAQPPSELQQPTKIHKNIQQIPGNDVTTSPRLKLPFKSSPVNTRSENVFSMSQRPLHEPTRGVPLYQRHLQAKTNQIPRCVANTSPTTGGIFSPCGRGNTNPTMASPPVMPLSVTSHPNPGTNVPPLAIQRWKTNLSLHSPELNEATRRNELSVIKKGKSKYEPKDIKKHVPKNPAINQTSTTTYSVNQESLTSSPKPAIYRPWVDSPGKSPNADKNNKGQMSINTTQSCSSSHIALPPITTQEIIQPSQSTSSLQRPCLPFAGSSPSRDKRRSDGDTSLGLSHPGLPSPPTSPRQNLTHQNNSPYHPQNFNPRIVVSQPYSQQDIRSLLRKEPLSSGLRSPQPQFDQSEVKSFIHKMPTQSVLPNLFSGETPAALRSFSNLSSPGLAVFKSARRQAMTKLDFGSATVSQSPWHAMKTTDLESLKSDESRNTKDTPVNSPASPSVHPRDDKPGTSSNDPNKGNHSNDPTKGNHSNDKLKKKKRKADDEVDVHLEMTDLLAERQNIKSSLREMEVEMEERHCECATAEKEILISAVKMFEMASEMESAQTDTSSEIRKNNEVIKDSLEVKAIVRKLCQHGRKVNDVFPGSVVLRIKCPTLVSVYDLCDLHVTGQLSWMLSEITGVSRMDLSRGLALRVTLNSRDVMNCRSFLLNKVCSKPAAFTRRRTPLKKSGVGKSPGKRVARSTENLLSSPTFHFLSPCVHERSSSTPQLPVRSPLTSPLSARSPLSTNNSGGFRRERNFSFGESTLTRIAFQELNLSDADSPVSPSLSASSLKDEIWMSGEVARRLFSSSPLLSPRRRHSPVTSPIPSPRRLKRCDMIHERENLDLRHSANQ